MTTDFRRAPWWPTAIDLELGLAHRPQPSVPHMTRPMWTDALDELVRVRDWVLWNHAKRKGPRPNVWKRAPLYAKDALARYEKAHPKPKPPPVPPPPPIKKSKWVKPPWAKRGIHTTWDPLSVLPRILTSKAAWAAMEGIPADHDTIFPTFRDQLHAAGKPALWWWRADVKQSAVPPSVDYVRHVVHDLAPDGLLFDIEVFPVLEPDTPSQVAAEFPNMPRAVLIAGMPDAATLKPWVDADFDCLTQAYGHEHGSIAGSMDSDAKWRGFPVQANGHYSWPVVEVNSEDSLPLAPQLAQMAQFGEDYSVYAGEIMTDADWDAFNA